MVKIVKGISEGIDVTSFEEEIKSLPNQEKKAISERFGQMADYYSSMATIVSKQGDVRAARKLRKYFRSLILLKTVAMMEEGYRIVW